MLIDLENLQNQLSNKDPETILKYILNEFEPTDIIFTTSLSNEDQVITYLIMQICPEIPIVTIDTGRLFQETYFLIEQTQDFFKIKIHVLFPDYTEVEKMVNEFGINLFYKSYELRRLCCEVRKTKVLRRILNEKKIWITGLRQQQSITRYAMKEVEWDKIYQIIKVNPIVRWSENHVKQYINAKGIPYNKLYDIGYKSIGCQPCTRPVEPHEHERAGRWWWENLEHKECGLHK